MVDRLASIKKQIAALEKKAKDLLKAQNQKVVDRVRALIDKHGLTAEDLGFAAAPQARDGARRAATAGTGQGGVPRYRDPESGKTWTGRGKPPSWIASAKDRSSYLIGETTAEAAPKQKRPRAAGATNSIAKGKAKGRQSAAATATKKKASPLGRGAAGGKSAALKVSPLAKKPKAAVPSNKRKSPPNVPKTSAPDDVRPTSDNEPA